jgi:hypothetical protein
MRLGIAYIGYTGKKPDINNRVRSLQPCDIFGGHISLGLCSADLSNCLLYFSLFAIRSRQGWQASLLAESHSPLEPRGKPPLFCFRITTCKKKHAV